jgi:hypothetical protein
MKEFKTKISEKITGDIYVGIIKDALKGGRTYTVTEEQFNHPNVQTLILKKYATVVESPKQNKIIEKEEQVVLEKENEMTTWDAENQKLLNEQSSKHKALSNNNTVEMKLQVNDKVDLSNESQNEKIDVENEDVRVSFKQKKDGSKKVGRPRKNASNKNKTGTKKTKSKFVYDNMPEKNIEFVDKKQEQELLNIRSEKLQKKRLNAKEKAERLKKYLTLDEDIDDSVDLNGEVS